MKINQEQTIKYLSIAATIFFVVWGIISILTKNTEKSEEEIYKIMLKKKILTRGDGLCVTCGRPVNFYVWMGVLNTTLCKKHVDKFIQDREKSKHKSEIQKKSFSPYDLDPEKTLSKCRSYLNGVIKEQVKREAHF